MAFLGKQVFAARRESMQAFMTEHGLDGLAFLTPDYFFYATNFFLDVRPWERPVAVVVPKNGEPFAIMHELSTNHIAVARERGTLWVDDITIYSEHPRLVNRLHLTPQWPDLMAVLLRERGLSRARLGVDSTAWPMGQVPGLLRGLELVPLEREMRELRMVKTDEEIGLIRQCASLTDWAQDCYRENVRAGRLVQELDRSIEALVSVEAANRFPGENVHIFIWSLSGPDSAAPHGNGAPNSARIERGHGIVNIIVIRLNGLVVENERTWFCGQPSQRQIEAYEVVTEAQQAAVGQLYTGNSLAAVDAAALAVIERAGLGAHVLHRTGHGIGIAGHEFPDDMAFNPRPLRANEIYSAEPGIYIVGVGGFRQDDTVIVGDNPEVVTKTSLRIEDQTVG